MTVGNPFIATTLVGSFVSEKKNFLHILVPSVFSLFKGHWGRGSFLHEKPGTRKGAFLVGFVEQNITPKEKALTRKNKDKSQRIGRKRPKRALGF